MKKVILLCLAITLTLTACAHVNRTTPDQEFEAYRTQVKSQRDARTITAVEEQERLRDQYWRLYGKDSESTGHFAYSVSLMRSAQAGDFPMSEADALVAAREQELFALRMASRQARSSYEYPPN